MVLPICHQGRKGVQDTNNCRLGYRMLAFFFFSLFPSSFLVEKGASTTYFLFFFFLLLRVCVFVPFSLFPSFHTQTHTTNQRAQGKSNGEAQE